MGGTELLAERLLKGTKKELFKNTNIIFNPPELYEQYLVNSKNHLISKIYLTTECIKNYLKVT